MTPAGKLNYLRERAPADISLMIGNSINNATILAGAHLLIALQTRDIIR